MIYFNKYQKGQATIWIIVSIIIVGVIGVIIFNNYLPGRSGGGGAEELEIKNYIDKCTRDNAEKIADEMLKHGGFLNPPNYKIYNNISVEYLCKNNGYFKPCINQHPAYITELENELALHLAPKIEKCFEDFDKQLEKKGAELMKTKSSTEILLAPGKILFKIERNMTLELKGQRYEYKEFNSELDYPAYDLANLAREIVNSEVKYCYFEYAGYMILHPEIKISKRALTDETRIYELEHFDLKKKLTFAIRGCAVPPGI